jgi:transposase-like protein
MRNILVKVSHRDKARLAEKLKQIWFQPDRGSAERLTQLIIEEYEVNILRRCAVWRKAWRILFNFIISQR